jgi:archaemetzincin
VEEAVVADVKAAVASAFALPVETQPALPEPVSAWDPARRQYSSSPILEAVRDACPRGAAKLLALTERDLFIPMLSFLYGQAQVDGVAALVSLARLRQEFYGLPPRADILLERTRKEALHELGHAFGLVHCQDRGCVMSLATNIRQLDVKGSGFCGGCRALLDDRLWSGEERTEL